jgi:Fur family ferric uptake transcriptional regulator
VKTPKSELSLEDAKAVIRSAGLRCTAARIAVVQCLSDNGSPMSPTEVAERLEPFGFDKSTIYRSLTEFNEAGVAVRLDLGDSIRRFELISAKGETTEHPHFMCVECGDIRCLSGFRVEVKPSNRAQKLPGEIAEVLLKGRCRSCA